MTFFLIDESISPKLAGELRKFGYNAKAIREIGLTGYEDEKIVAYAIKNNAVIIAGDLDFGELWYWSYKGKLGVIILRIKSYTFEDQLMVLRFFHSKGVLKDKKIKTSLVISTMNRYRIRTVDN